MAKQRLTTENASDPLNQLQDSPFFKDVRKKTVQGMATQEGAKKKRGRPRSERETTRHSFEFYVDQVEDIYRLVAIRQLNEKRNVTLSDIVREALAEYIKKHKEVLDKYKQLTNQ